MAAEDHGWSQDPVQLAAAYAERLGVDAYRACTIAASVHRVDRKAVRDEWLRQLLKGILEKKAEMADKGPAPLAIPRLLDEPAPGRPPVSDSSPFGFRRERGQQHEGEAVGGLSVGDFADVIAARRCFHLSIKAKGIDAEHWRVFLITWIYK